MFLTDDENDFITLSNNDDLAEAKKFLQDGILKIIIKGTGKYWNTSVSLQSKVKTAHLLID